MNLKEKQFSKGELTKICLKIPVTELLDRESRLFRDKGLHVSSLNSDMVFNAILETPLLVKTPIVRSGHEVVSGFDEKKLKERFCKP